MWVDVNKGHENDVRIINMQFKKITEERIMYMDLLLYLQGFIKLGNG